MSKWPDFFFTSKSNSLVLVWCPRVGKIWDTTSQQPLGNISSSILSRKTTIPGNIHTAVFQHWLCSSSTCNFLISVVQNLKPCKVSCSWALQNTLGTTQLCRLVLTAPRTTRKVWCKSTLAASCHFCAGLTSKATRDLCKYIWLAARGTELCSHRAVVE